MTVFIPEWDDSIVLVATWCHTYVDTLWLHQLNNQAPFLHTNSPPSTPLPYSTPTLYLLLFPICFHTSILSFTYSCAPLPLLLLSCMHINKYKDYSAHTLWNKGLKAFSDKRIVIERKASTMLDSNLFASSHEICSNISR